MYYKKTGFNSLAETCIYRYYIFLLGILKLLEETDIILKEHPDILYPELQVSDTLYPHT